MFVVVAQPLETEMLKFVKFCCVSWKNAPFLKHIVILLGVNRF